MPRLCELQKAFAEAIEQGQHRAVTDALVAGGSALRSVALYRRLIRNNYRHVLAITYPVLHRFVGERYFTMLTRGYDRRHPSTSGDLYPYGRHFSAFLQALPVDPVLWELARLEWVCHEIHQAADSVPVALDRLQAVAQVDPARVTVRFHPATRFLSFPFPIHRVWQALQPDAAENEGVDLPLLEEATHVVVTRIAGQVQVRPVPSSDFAMFEALSHGADLAFVERCARESDPEFDCLRWWATALPLVNGVSVKEIA